MQDNEAGFLSCVAAASDHAQIVAAACRLLRKVTAYALGDLRAWSADLPLAPSRETPFRRRVWEACRTIPFGQVRTYRELACEIGSPRAARAVGAALGANPLPLVIPCHRVVRGDGTLGGYSAPGGLAVKSWLLAFEKECLQKT
ncbi:MAG: methylated-DNA--[protein]-cysteine S-methyltransferase [Planctomycetota bacterium]|nr:MAG: methylated-DNA--[protein]-cysteine S-methyltransferase [Planctomycetota bacterium]